MEYLSVLDATLLEAEDADPHVSLAVGALAVLGGPYPNSDHSLLTTGIERTVARLTQLASKDARQVSSR
jgi:diacylglycerol O-acyltransferase / wax synthase